MVDDIIKNWIFGPSDFNEPKPKPKIENKPKEVEEEPKKSKEVKRKLPKRRK